MPVYCVALMMIFENYSPGMVMYGVLHGTYGVIWLVKHLAMPDPSWNQYITLMSTIVMWGGVLGPYCIPAYLLASGRCPEPSLARIAFCAITYIFGVVLMLASDAQKYFTLKYINYHKDAKTPKKPFLIEEGFARYTRNPNYLGEIMLYFAFFNLTQHWISYSIGLFVWFGIFSVRMAQKDASLRQKPGWNEYRDSSWILIPKIGGNPIVSLLFYGSAAWLFFRVYTNLPAELAAPLVPRL